MLQLFGRAEMAALVRQAMAERGRAGPVLVFEGSPGSGKTSLLDALADLLSNRVPCALVDLNTVRLHPDQDKDPARGKDPARDRDPDRDKHGAIPSLLAQLAFQLARQSGGYGALRFPRLVIGLLVQELDLPRADREAARRQVEAALGAYRGVDRWTGVLGEVAAGLIAKAPGGSLLPASAPGGILTALLRVANRWGPARRFLLGPYQQWYAHQDLGLPGQAIDALVELTKWADTANANPDHQHRIDDLMLRAFLADLRDAYRRAERTGGWSYNSVVLLDNVDGDLGQAFLTELVRIRSSATAGGTAGQDPLTVVVTSRGRLLSVVEDGVAMAGSGEDDESAQGQWWRRIPLPPLAPTEISAMIDQLALSRGNTQHLATVVHDLTRGQAAATKLLLGEVRTQGRADVDLATLLRRQVEEKSLEQRLLDRLLAGVEVASSPDLQVCAAARSPEPVRRLARGLRLAQARRGLEAAPLWGLDDDGVTLARRLLLRRLAASPPRWKGAFEALRADAAAQQDVDLGLYYAAGLGEWGHIATELDRRLGPGAMPGWLDDLHRIAEAPTRPLPGTEPDGFDPAAEASGHEILEEAEGLAEAPGREAPEEMAAALAEPWITEKSPPRFVTVLNLLTALSVSRDPLCGNNRGELYRRIGDYYRELSEQPNLGCRELDKLERRYRRLGPDWYDG